MIVSPAYFLWFCTALVAGTAGSWLIVDIVRLRRALPEGKKAHDRIFGSIIGLIVAAIGIIGVLRYHLG